MNRINIEKKVQLVPDDAQYRAQYTALYENAFPANERRATDVWLDMKRKEFGRWVVLYDDAFAGFVTVWHFDAFMYVEHFAILPELRGKGIGAHVLMMLREKYGVPFVLEVEMPEDEMSIRRVGFYERCGLTLYEQEYKQPPYDAQFGWTPMRLMGSDMRMSDEQFRRVQRQLYTVVYDCE